MGNQANGKIYLVEPNDQTDVPLVEQRRVALGGPGGEAVHVFRLVLRGGEGEDASSRTALLLCGLRGS